MTTKQIDWLAAYGTLISSYDSHPHAVDIAHGAVLWAMVLARKPRRVLELGIGTGFLSRTILYAMAYNGTGELTCVDNWYDTGGQEPPIAKALREMGAVVVQCDEYSHLVSTLPDSYDIVVSDADHYHSHRYVTLHANVCKADGLLFYHDVNLPMEFPGLYSIRERFEKAGWPCQMFDRSTREGERCERGWLMVTNKKL